MITDRESWTRNWEARPQSLLERGSQEQHFRYCEVTSLQYGIRLLADDIYKITPQESCFMLPHAHDFKDFGAREIESVSREMIPNYMSLDNVTRWQSNCLLHLLLQSRIL